jgi:hypothetical protein
LAIPPGTLKAFQTQVVDHSEEPPGQVFARTPSLQVLKQSEESLLDNLLTVLNVQGIKTQQLAHQTIAQTVKERQNLRLQR